MQEACTTSLTCMEHTRMNILYSFRRCPYAMRARWAILNSGKSVVIREVDLKSKPKSLLEYSPKGTVPILIINREKILDESLDIMKWAIQESPIEKNMSNLSIERNQKANEIIKQNDLAFKYHLDRFKYSFRYEESNRSLHKSNARKILIEWDRRINDNGWILDNQETFVDWALWPFVRQYSLVKESDFQDDNSLINIRKWLEQYLKNHNFSLLMHKYKTWDEDDQALTFPSQYV